MQITRKTNTKHTSHDICSGIEVDKVCDLHLPSKRLRDQKTDRRQTILWSNFRELRKQLEGKIIVKYLFVSRQ